MVIRTGDTDGTARLHAMRTIHYTRTIRYVTLLLLRALLLHYVTDDARYPAGQASNNMMTQIMVRYCTHRRFSLWRKHLIILRLTL